MKSPWFRRIAMGLVALVALLVVAASVLIASFDANRYKSLAIDWMKAEHQRTLAIDGPLELSFFPRLALKVSKLRLSERASSQPFAEIEEASFAVKLLPLLSKQLVVDRVGGRGIHATYLRSAGGARNVDDWLPAAANDAGASARAPPASAPGGGSLVRLDISAIRFDDLRLTLRDEMAGLAGEVEVPMFASGRIAAGVASPLALKANVRLTQPQPTTLVLDGSMTLTPDAALHGVGLSDVKLDVQAERGGAGSAALALDATLSGALAWDGSALRAGPLQLALKGATFGAIALTPSTASVARVLFDPAARRLELESLQLALNGHQGANAFEVSLVWPQLAVDPGGLRAGGAGAALKGPSGRIKLAGPNTLEGEFHSAAPSGNFDALAVNGLEMTLAGANAAAKLDAKVRADVVLALGRKAANWKLDGLLNTNRFSSSGEAAFAGRVPNIKANARFDALDLNTVLAPDKAAPAAASSPAPAPADTPVPLDGLRAVDGQFTLQAGALAWRQYRLADANLAATLDAGMLRITRLSARAWGGSVEASGSADAGRRRVALQLDAKDVNVDALLKNVAGKDLLEGSGRVVANLEASGASVGALRSNLAGTASLQLHDGAVKGINLARVLRQAQAALTMKEDAISRASAVEKTDFSELRASARVAGGVAQSDDLDLKSPFLRIGGAGRLDIGRGRIDYTARASVTDSAIGQGGAGLEALRGVTVPVVLSGPFDAIDWKVQWSGVAAAALRNRLQDKLGEAIGKQLGIAQPGAASAPGPKPEDLIKDRLKGLFK